MKALSLLIPALLLGACSFMPGSSQAPEATLSDLRPIDLPDPGGELPSVNLAQLADSYQQVLLVTDDPAVRLQVVQRLAGLEMLQAEERLAQSETQEPFFEDAIVLYQNLLNSSAGDTENDRLLYQLSKAYDLGGDTENSRKVLEQLSQKHPQSNHYIEAEFRVAEAYFSAGEYYEAELAYARVIGRGDDSAYYANALYMHGWSQFKQDKYRASIDSFSLALDLLVPADNQLQELDTGRRELALDCFRVLAVVFSYLDGPQTIASVYDQLGVRNYQALFYQHLGELYRKQQRYRDSAETYRAFNMLYPDSVYAHEFQLGVIEIYQAGGFPDLVIEEKQNYVTAYGVTGDYWLGNEAGVREAIRPQLKQFIEELATHHHALAQAYVDEGGSNTEQRAALYLEAGKYYELYISSFADDERVPDMGFLLAESRFEAGDARTAIDVYEWVAYEYPDFEFAADAGYSAILAYETLIEETPGAEREGLRRDKIEGQLHYSARFSDDPRAPLVLSDAATALFDTSEYQLAIIAAATLIRWQPLPGNDVVIPAWLVIAHSYFEMKDYPPAEQAYQQALARLPQSDKRQPEVLERLAATVYLQGEAAALAENHQLAADHFSRVIALAPGASIRLQAQFDAAGHYTELGDYAEANRLLVDFRQRFAGHPLSADIAVKLANNYEQLGQWQESAVELDAMLLAEAEPERKRQLLYLAAEQYDKAGLGSTAILRYRSYANDWPEPMSVRLEAINRLGELYAQEGQEGKRQFWLRKMMKVHDSAPEQTARSLYLAAFAANELADDEYRRFETIDLRYPLKSSLKKKNEAMQAALVAYRKAYDYGVAEFSTQATFQMGEIYQNLVESLMASERPGKLDELALEQYELLLEEQAYPFEEKAIAIHESNARRSWEGLYNDWVKNSFAALAALSPARYSKSELVVRYSGEIY
jgi:tetratricopeptide (TPR) repeat protein